MPGPSDLAGVGLDERGSNVIETLLYPVLDMVAIEREELGAIEPELLDGVVATELHVPQAKNRLCQLHASHQ